MLARWRIAAFACLGSIVVAASAVRADGGFQLADLMGMLASRHASNAHFTERRYMKMLTEPLKSMGTLAYVAPDKLEKVTLWPKLQRMAVDGDRLVMEPGPDGNPKVLSLAAQPEIAAFVEAIRGTLAGNLPGLERFYDVSLQGDLANWSLRLQPRGETPRKLLDSVLLKGRGPQIETIDVKETDGDRTEMIILADAP
jgi:hypothetical protein